MLPELHDLNERWYRAWLEKDAAAVERLMSDDYLYIAPGGIMIDRDRILAVIRSPTYRLDSCTRSETLIRPLGPDAAFIRHRCQAAGEFEGQPFNDDHRCLIVWERRDDRWQIVIEQCSFTAAHGHPA